MHGQRIIIAGLVASTATFLGSVEYGAGHRDRFDAAPRYRDAIDDLFGPFDRASSGPRGARGKFALPIELRAVPAPPRTLRRGEERRVRWLRRALGATRERRSRRKRQS